MTGPEERPSPTATRVAVWSGPRNISTALMRAWENRPDTAVIDEPFYAHYLRETGLEHPGREEILAHHDADWQRVAGALTGPPPGGAAIFYQKHMAHHLLPPMWGRWLFKLRHAFLIREPAEMLASLARVLPEIRLEDTGLPQQVRLRTMLAAEGVAAPVIDARDVLEAPQPLLAALCGALGVPFDDAMLRWAPGPRPTDGVWAKHWYANVERSTGFRPYRPGHAPLPDHLRSLYDACRPLYEELHADRLVR